MQRSSSKRRIVSRAPVAAIVLSEALQPRGQSRAGLILVLFMRALAVLSVAQGLAQWAPVLSTGIDGQSGLGGLSVPGIVAVVFFAVIEPIAAVGLWLVAPWGGVIWLVTAGAQLLVVVTMRDFYAQPLAVACGTLLLISVYLLLIWRVSADADRRDAA